MDLRDRHYLSTDEYAELRAYAARSVRNHPHLDADDLVQQTVCQLAGPVRGQPPKACRDAWNQAYAMVALRNLAIDHFHRQRLIASVSLDEKSAADGTTREQRLVSRATTDPFDIAVGHQATLDLATEIGNAAVSPRGWQALLAVATESGPFDDATRQAAFRAATELKPACLRWLSTVLDDPTMMMRHLTTTQVIDVLCEAGIL